MPMVIKYQILEKIVKAFLKIAAERLFLGVVDVLKPLKSEFGKMCFTNKKNGRSLKY